jgi:sporulation protein YabP
MHRFVQDKEGFAMTEERLPHKMTLNERKNLTMTGVSEVLRFDDSAVVLKTALGVLEVQGRELKLKTLSLEGGQMAVEGHICAVIYEEPREGSLWQRLWQ